MALIWTKTHDHWVFGDPDARFDLATVLEDGDTSGLFYITWYWTDTDEEEVAKECMFTGTLEEAKAYAAALSRMGVPE